LETPLAQAVQLMAENRVSGLPVVDGDGKLAGILTEGDLLHRAETETAEKRTSWFSSFFLPGREAAHYVLSHDRHIKTLMTTEVVTVREDTSLSDAAFLMRRNHIKPLPVLRDGHLVGIVSRADLVRRLGEFLAAEASDDDDDQKIHAAIHDAMEREPWARSKIACAVQDGVVQLDGCLFDLNEREALGVLAENTAGVKRVENRIVCIDPTSGIVTCNPND
jgi:CBS domain-containing protein